MNERRLSALLRSTSVPDEDAAAERAWQLIRAAHADRQRSPRHTAVRGLGKRRAVALVLVGAALAAAALSPPGRAVLGSLREAVAPRAASHPHSELGALPTHGNVLVAAADGAWIVHADGTKRHLGPYRDATWSPHGLYVAAARGRELVAVDPQGNVRWTVSARQPVRLPAWSPTDVPGDTRIAYLAGTVLHVVGGDSRGDRAIALAVASVRPAWRPQSRFVLAFASARAVHVYAVEPLRLLWHARLPQTPTELEWSSDGSRLLAVSPRALRVFDASGRLVRRGAGAVAAAFAPGTREPFEVRKHGAQTSVSSLVTGRVLFSTPGEIDGLMFAPGGRWLVLGWRSADVWVFLRRGSKLVVPVANVSQAFGPGSGPARFPTLAGWCCGG